MFIHLKFVFLLAIILSAIFAEYLYDSVRISEAQLNVKMKDNKQKERPLGTLDIPLNEKLPKLVRLSKNFNVQLSFRVVDSVSGQPIEKLQQKFLRFSHSKSPGHEVFFVAKEHKDMNGFYRLEMAMSRDFVRFNARPGKYNCELILGDRRVRSALTWTIFDAFLDIPKSQQEEVSYKPRKRYDPKAELLPEIQHKFAKVESCNQKHWLFSCAFCLLCLLPLIMLIYYWRSLFLNALQNILPASAALAAPLFFNALMFVLFALYFLCWVLDTPIATELQFGAAIAIPCFFAAHKMLKNLAIERIEAEKEMTNIASSLNGADIAEEIEEEISGEFNNERTTEE